jgi:glycosyltransferase involved in cell wall biosynthesis
MTAPLVSVLMTAYNREKYIAEAIESVLASTFADFELIIVDDCSRDRTVEIAKSYAARDSRVSVHVNEKNLGDYPNRNRAASLARGAYIKYVDADDVIYSHGLEVMVRCCSGFPGAAFGLASLAQDFHRPYPFELSPREAYMRHYFDQPLFDRAPLSAIIRKEQFERVGGFSGKRMVGDFELWHILAARYPVVLMPQGVIWYRKHSEQEIRLYHRDPRYFFEYLLVAFDQLSRPECPLPPAEKARVLTRIKRSQARFAIRTFARGQWRYSRQMFRRSNAGFSDLLRAPFPDLLRN